MEPRFLEYYIRELLYMRELAQEFAQAHPKVARRLGMQAGEIGDPYVERLLEAFSWSAARSQLRIDAAFPQLTQRLLETIYPNYVRPTPSMSVARFFPSQEQGNCTDAVTVGRGTEFTSLQLSGDGRTACIFTSSQDVTLYPLEIVSARLTGIPPDIASPDRWIPPYRQVRGALRLTLRTFDQYRIAQLHDLDRLPVYLAGEESIASRLFELIHAASLVTVTGRPGKFGEPGEPLHVVPHNAVVHEAMDPGQGLMPLNWPKFHGHNLLHEYFACPSRFYFFTLTGLRRGLASIDQNEAEIVILLDQSPADLARQVDASQFALFCTPVINLFAAQRGPLELEFSNDEALLVPDGLHPADYEVFSIEQLQAFASKNSEKLEFVARDTALVQDEGNPDRYFALRHEVDAPVAGARHRYGTHMAYTPSRLYVSLVDGHDRPYSGMKYAAAWLWLTNADLPCLLERNARTDLEPACSMPADSIGLIRPPSMPWAPLAQGETAWELLSQLNLHESAFYATGAGDTARGLRKRLRLFIPQASDARRREVDSIMAVHTEPVTRRLPGNGPLKFGRGMGIRLTVDESGFDGASPYLLGQVLQYWLARLVSQHSFVHVELHTVQRGLVARWPVRMGTRSVL